MATIEISLDALVQSVNTLGPEATLVAVGIWTMYQIYSPSRLPATKFQKAVGIFLEALDNVATQYQNDQNGAVPNDTNTTDNDVQK